MLLLLDRALHRSLTHPGTTIDFFILTVLAIFGTWTEIPGMFEVWFPKVAAELATVPLWVLAMGMVAESLLLLLSIVLNFPRLKSLAHMLVGATWGFWLVSFAIPGWPPLFFWLLLPLIGLSIVRCSQIPFESVNGQ